VAPILRDSVVEVFSVLEGLELVSSRITTERLTDQGAQTLTTLLAEMDEAIQSQRYDDWSDLNARFHLTIAQLTAMPMLQEMVARALDHWDRVRRYYFTSVLRHRAEQSQKEHHTLVRLMRDRDGPGVERLITSHNRGALAAYMEYIAAHPDGVESQAVRGEG
jgi:DNA-binding GntR family transcriptional regulator